MSNEPGLESWGRWYNQAVLRTTSFGAAHDLRGHLTQALHGESDFTKDLKGLDTKSRTPTGQRSTKFFMLKRSLCPLLVISPKELLKARSQEIFAPRHVHSSTIYNSQVVETPQMPTDRWVDQQNAVCPCSGILRNLKKEGTLVTCYKMDAKWN